MILKINKNKCTKFALKHIQYLAFYMDMNKDVDIAKWNDYDYYWCRSMNTENGILGAFDWKIKNSIFIQYNPIVNVVPDMWIKKLMPTIVHELTHARQYNNNKFLYHFKAIPFLRNILLEKEAKANEHIASINIGLDNYEV